MHATTGMNLENNINEKSQETKATHFESISMKPKQAKLQRKIIKLGLKVAGEYGAGVSFWNGENVLKLTGDGCTTLRMY